MTIIEAQNDRNLNKVNKCHLILKGVLRALNQLGYLMLDSYLSQSKNKCDYLMCHPYINLKIHKITNDNRNSEIIQTRNEILEVTAFCASDHTTQAISGTYIAKGVFGSHIIYEKTVASKHGRWWSLRYDRPSEDPTINRWIFMYSGQQVTIGESIFGSIIEKYSNRPG